MENFSKYQESTSSSFYQTQNKKLKYLQPIKSSFPSLYEVIEQYKDRSVIMELQESINLFNKKLRQSEQGILKLAAIEELKILLQKCQISLNQAKSKCFSAQTQIKSEIECMINCLEKQLQTLKKGWQKIKEQCQTELVQQIEQVKKIKKKDELLVTSLLKSTSQEMKNQINNFAIDLKQTRKIRNNSTGKLFGQLDQIKFNLQSLLNQEEEKRNQYDEIIYNLLEKTCQNTQESLRRRVY